MKAITMKDIETRFVEGLDGLGFILYPKYVCKCCNRTKSALELDDLVTMGVPGYIIRRCPVVVFQKSAATQDLADTIMNLRTSDLGASQVSNFIKKRDHPSMLAMLPYAYRSWLAQ